MSFNERIAIIGLGYVGLPLATEFAKKYKVIGYDVDMVRIKELKRGIDKTKEISKKKFLLNKNLLFTNNYNHMKNSDFFILTVPTPITKNKKPDLSIIKKAAFTVAKVMKKGTIIILESTVYPGVTEDYLVPILEKQSKLKHKKDFFVAYSPERINPGETKYKLTNIKKIVGADNETTLSKVSKIYKKIIKAGIHKVSSIKVAEASKAIENAQRDINIAFVNEVMMLSKALNINSNEVLEAAKTKWNFLDFSPGLVGGHCIGVDPYYLTYKANKIGYESVLTLAGRRLNDNMHNFILKKLYKSLNKNLKKKKYKFLIIGLTFKENVNDFRNSRSIVLAKEISKNGHNLDVYDKNVSIKEFKKEHRLNIIKKPKKKHYDAILITVAHDDIKKFKIEYLYSLLNDKEKGKIFDVKNVFNQKKFLTI